MTEFTNIPFDAILIIMSFLNPQSLLNLGHTCKYMYSYTSTRRCWEIKTKSLFPLMYSSDHCFGFKIYRSLCIFLENSITIAFTMRRVVSKVSEHIYFSMHGEESTMRTEAIYNGKYNHGYHEKMFTINNVKSEILEHSSELEIMRKSVVTIFGDYLYVTVSSTDRKKNWSDENFLSKIVSEIHYIIENKVSTEYRSQFDIKSYTYDKALKYFMIKKLNTYNRFSQKVLITDTVVLSPIQTIERKNSNRIIKDGYMITEDGTMKNKWVVK